MANPEVVNYIRQYKDRYSLPSLKQALQQQGYTSQEVEEALREAIAPPRNAPRIPPTPTPVPLAPARTPSPPSKNSNTWILVLILLLLVPLLLVGCLVAIPMMFFASTAGWYAQYLPFLAKYADTHSESPGTLNFNIKANLPPGPSTKSSGEPKETAEAHLTLPVSPKKTELRKVTDFHTLMEALPTSIPNYAPQKPEGGQTTFPSDQGKALQYSTASNEYKSPTNPKDHIKITLIDTGAEESLAFMINGFGIEYENTEGYRKKTSVQGHTAWETYTYKDNKASLTVNVNDQIGVLLEGSAPLDTIRDTANRVNYAVLEKAEG